MLTMLSAMSMTSFLSNKRSLHFEEKRQLSAADPKAAAVELQ